MAYHPSIEARAARRHCNHFRRSFGVFFIYLLQNLYPHMLPVSILSRFSLFPSFDLVAHDIALVSCEPPYGPYRIPTSGFGNIHGSADKLKRGSATGRNIFLPNNPSLSKLRLFLDMSEDLLHYQGLQLLRHQRLTNVPRDDSSGG